MQQQVRTATVSMVGSNNNENNHCSELFQAAAHRYSQHQLSCSEGEITPATNMRCAVVFATELNYAVARNFSNESDSKDWRNR